MGTKFEIVTGDEMIIAAIKPALAAAAKASEKDITKRGVVIAQVFIREEDGKARIVGDYIEHEYAFPVFEAFQARAEKMAARKRR